MPINSQLSSDADIEELFAQVSPKIEKKIQPCTIPSTIVIDQSEKKMAEEIQFKKLKYLKKSYSELQPNATE